MYAFADETGNTGENLFDEAQPNFITAALITKSDFDVLHATELGEIAARVGEASLHANRLGTAKLEVIAEDLRRLLRKADARFAISRVEKRYLLVTKIVDYVFDSGENLAVPWHAYSLRFGRLLLVFKAARLVDSDLAAIFWGALMARKQSEGLELFVQACRILLERVSVLPDARGRQIFSEALEWAIANPRELTIHSNDKIGRYAHLPNVVGFINLLDGIDKWSEILDRPVKRIRHDRQSQFEKNFKFVHDLLTNASDEPLLWPGEEPNVLRKVFGSELDISSSDQSAGIQVADLMLWLLRRRTVNESLGPNAAKLFNFMVGRGRIFDFSFESAASGMKELDSRMPKFDELDEATRAKARSMLEREEERRRNRLAEHESQKAIGDRSASPAAEDEVT